MIVTIDGPAGAGKSTVARQLAQRLGFRYLDTGAMYRAVALAALRAGLDWQQPGDLARLAGETPIRVAGDRIFLDDEDVTEAVRTPKVTAATRYVADNPQVRAQMVELQCRIAVGADIVTEGRDQGSAVFPAAECKIYLTASAEERARRRVEDFRAGGTPADFEEVLREINRRDAGDAARPVGPLVRPADAVEVVTDGLAIDEVVARLETIVRARMAKGDGGAG